MLTLSNDEYIPNTIVADIKLDIQKIQQTRGIQPADRIDIFQKFMLSTHTYCFMTDKFLSATVAKLDTMQSNFQHRNGNNNYTKISTIYHTLQTLVHIYRLHSDIHVRTALFRYLLRNSPTFAQTFHESLQMYKQTSSLEEQTRT